MGRSASAGLPKASQEVWRSDKYVFLALAGAGKAIISVRVGKRNGENCRAFFADLRARVLGAPEISPDAFPAYPDAVERAFGSECRFGTIEKH
jgi:hypothetical protein